MNRKSLGILFAAAMGAALAGCASDDGNPPPLSGFQMDRLHGHQTVGGVTVGAAPTPAAQSAGARDIDDEHAVRASGTVAPRPQPQGPFYSESGLDRARAGNENNANNSAAGGANYAQPQNVSGPGTVFVDGNNDGFDDNTGAARNNNTNNTNSAAANSPQGTSSRVANSDRATGRGGATGNNGSGANSGNSSGGPPAPVTAGSNNNPSPSNSAGTGGSTGGSTAGSTGGNSGGSSGGSAGGSGGSKGSGGGPG